MELNEVIRKNTILETQLNEYHMRNEEFGQKMEELKLERREVEKINSQLKADLEECRKLQKRAEDQYDEAIDRERREKEALLDEFDKARAQMMTPQRLELLRHEIRTELDVPYRERLDAVENELEQYISKFNKLRYEYSFLQAEHENRVKDNQTVIEDLQNRHKLELESLLKERKDWLAKRDEDQPYNTQMLRNLQRENTQLTMKVKVLLDEVEELKQQRESQGLQAEQNAHSQGRELAEARSLCKALETEKESAVLQCERLQDQIQKSLEEQDGLAAKLRESERDCMTLKSRLNDMEHRHKVELSNLKLSLMQGRGELERQRDALVADMEAAENKIDVLERTVEEMSHKVAGSEREFGRRIQAAADAEVQKLTDLEQEKLELESQLAEMERSTVDVSAVHSAQVEKLEEEALRARGEKGLLARECERLKSQLKEKMHQTEELEMERARASDFQHRSHQLQAKCQGLLGREQELLTSQDKYKSKLEALADELRKTRKEMKRRQEESALGQSKCVSEWEQERRDLAQRLDDSNQRNQSLSEKVQKVKAEAKKKLQQHKKQVQDMQNAQELLEATNKQADLQKERLRKQVEAENDKLKKRIREFHRRHTEFSFLLHSDAGRSGLLSAVHAFGNVPAVATKMAEQECRNQRELSDIKHRLERMTSGSEMDELGQSTQENSQADT
eukprot:m.63646 g.63646  ORF g.63646 m.63646 type:complete len:681 (+) comp35177_c0_seq2:34-2076(+)